MQKKHRQIQLLIIQMSLTHANDAEVKHLAHSKKLYQPNVELGQSAIMNSLKPTWRGHVRQRNLKNNCAGYRNLEVKTKTHKKKQKTKTPPADHCFGNKLLDPTSPGSSFTCSL